VESNKKKKNKNTKKIIKIRRKESRKKLRGQRNGCVLQVQEC
jgi:hypothetical protein